jgi:2-haloacid dehalogenase
LIIAGDVMIIKNNIPEDKRSRITIAFDVYGTIIDVAGVYNSLEKIISNNATLFMNTWRTKQLEYTFRRGLMQNYVDFLTCTKQSLEYTCNALNIYLSNDDKINLINQYDELPAFSDVENSLQDLKKLNYRLFAFSNGKFENVSKLLSNAKIDKYFDGIISVDDIKTYKPNPAVYAHFLRKSESKLNESFLISSNPFDVIGAISFGMQAIWIKRTNNVFFDPWEIEPAAIVESINDLKDIIKNC